MGAATILAVSCFAQSVDVENVPNNLLSRVSEARFSQAYELDGSMNPFYLRADLDGTENQTTLFG